MPRTIKQQAETMETAEQNPAILESSEDLQRQLEELQKKYTAALEQEEKEEVEMIELPVADILLKVGHGLAIPKSGLTPPEVAILAAAHHSSAGGNPVSNIVPTGTIKVDPMDLKKVLVNRYSAAKVSALFPGPVPHFPTKFLRAVKMGIGVSLNPERLFDFHVQPMTSGEKD
jgi:hypothetical protein